MKASALFVAALLGHCSFAEEPPCPGMFLNSKALLKLAHARTAADLKSAWKEIPVADPALKMIYADRLVHLQPGAKSDDALIRAIPSNELEYEFVYSITTGDLDQDAVLSGIAGGGWLRDAQAAILRQHHGMADFLRLSYFHNADLGEQIPELQDDLRKKAPRGFAQAIKSLPEEVRRTVCVDCESLPHS